ncbi:MerR family transcriptional regulator [Crassaminicella profunda]|uniref:MerR family transcriptional regulator n=1 Tax=Crassaminicella profunda TaxID=1286698 RepID=UPI001CA626BD|nr:MerR family transcriptional regulator [Crassaminicella profunda]QZY55181.1 GyrI-like domain-containing protein [Crassaminicella profunda]
MKKEYTIGEICKLYNIGPDSMRYYEKKGLITPRRRKNGYRIYSIEEVWKLNIIKDLRKLKFSVKQIKEYLEDRSIQSTKALVDHEIKLIEKEIESLEDTNKNLKRKLDSLKQINKIKDYEKIKIKNIPLRKIILIEQDVSKDEEIDLAFRKLQSISDEKVFLFGNKDMGAFISDEGMKRGRYNLYQKVFFFVEDVENYDYICLPEGYYATLVYKGAYEKSQRFISQMLMYIKKHHYSLRGNPLEIYRVDIHQTAKKEEFITEIQIPIHIG